jgi:type IV pilin/CARDB protein
MDVWSGSSDAPSPSLVDNVQIRDLASNSRGALPARSVTEVVSPSRRTGSSRWRRSAARRNRRGVSDVVATILLLALTVTLFASVFFFINTFPRPPPQPANQFSATLTYGGGGGASILYVNILHLAGPTIAGATTLQTAVYLQSAAKPSAFATPFTLGYGLNGSTTWALGQTWRGNVTSYLLTVPDNITISVIAQNQLLFRITLPGSNPNTPPIFSQAGVNPTTPAVSTTFTVFVGITDNNLKLNSVFVNFSQLPGVVGSGLAQMSLLATSGLWVYSVAGGSTSSGTFYIFVNATDLSGLQNSIAIPVTISNSGGSASTLSIQVTADNTAPVNGVPIQLEASVTNNGGSAVTVVVQFYVGGATVGGASSQGITAGATAVYTQAWTPASVGATPVQALATTTGASAEGGFSITVFPKILLISHAYPAGQFPVSNTSADLAQKLTAAGFPYTTMSVACGVALPSTATMKLYNVVIIDFGSATGLVCSQLPPGAGEQTKITGAATTVNFWLVGSNGFTATTCTSYSAAFQTQFGLATSGTCTASHVALSTATYTASVTAPALRADGLPGSLALTINQTFAGSNAFQPYYTVTTQASGKTWLKDSGAHIVGVYTNGSTNHQQMILATDPALITSAVPGGNVWGTAMGASGGVVYNAVNFLCGLSTTTNAGRGLPDYGIVGTLAVGLKHGLPTQFYVAVRANSPTGGAVFATLYVAGAPAYFQGSLVTGSVTLAGSGAWSWIAFNWSAPLATTYTLSVGLSTENLDMYLPNNQVPLSYYNSPTTFT